MLFRSNTLPAVLLSWQPVQQTVLPNQEVSFNQYFDGAILNKDLLPCYHTLIKNENTNEAVSATLEILRTEELKELTGIKNPAELSSDFTVTTSKLYKKKQAFTSIEVATIRRTSKGTLERLVEFRLNTQLLGTQPTRTQARSYTRNSIFASGQWIRLAVTSNGVYKIDYSLLKSLGIDPDNVDPRTIKIYGNGGGQLPYLNASTLYDDPQENAIFVSGESDGKFDAGDYVLFYGSEQTRWNYNAASGSFQHQINNY